MAVLGQPQAHRLYGDLPLSACVHAIARSAGADIFSAASRRFPLRARAASGPKCLRDRRSARRLFHDGLSTLPQERDRLRFRHEPSRHPRLAQSYGLASRLEVGLRSLARQAAEILRLDALTSAIEPGPDDRDDDHAEKDDNGNGPSADADGAGRLSVGLVLRNLAIALLVLVGRGHRPIPTQVLAVGAGLSVASNDDGWPATPLPPLTMATRLSASAASAAQRAAAAAAMKTAAVLHFSASSTPPTSGPMIEPTRPMPSAQPTPVARTAVG